jgi:hypothetical protein
MANGLGSIHSNLRSKGNNDVFYEDTKHLPVSRRRLDLGNLSKKGVAINEFGN